MKRQTTEPAITPAKPRATVDRTLHIEWRWSMPWMEYVDEILDDCKGSAKS